MQLAPNLLSENHADVFINMIMDINRQVMENPNKIPVVSIVDQKSHGPSRSPSTSHKHRSDDPEGKVHIQLLI